MEKLTAKSATHVWPNSNSLLEYIKEHKLAKPSKLEVISKGSSNGINLDRFSASALKEDKLNEIKKLINYDEQLIYFLSVGRIVHDKGIDELLGAFIEVYKKNARVRMLFVGAFEDEVDPVSEESKHIMKTHPGVIQAGWNDAVEYFMHFSYALVHPSHREGFPNVLLQAGALYCPVICSRIEGNVDIVDHEQTGLIFEVRNQNELQQRLEQALANPAMMKQYAANLRRKIEDHFDQKIVHREMKKRYLEILSK
jgi:glycosyltransferase involved in cell wall biosynthesis